MESVYVDLDEQTFILINGPLIFLSLTANIFYACCLMCNAQRLKQPLKMLLGFLVWCSIIYCVTLTSLYLRFEEERSFEMLAVLVGIVLCFVYNSITCSAWLNFYFYVQIVPAQRAVLTWIKRNLKSVMYTTLLLDVTLIFLCSAISTASTICHISWITDINGTWTVSEDWYDGLYFASQVCVYVTKLHTFSCLCIMTVASFSTAHYLYRHIRSVAQSDCCFSNPRIQSQIRVTITGISQGVLFFLYATFYLFSSVSHLFSLPFFLGGWSSCTISSLYILGTTVNLGIGQAIFRQRAANIWRALKALCSVGMVTNDVKMQSTSRDIANTVSVDVQMSV